LLISFLFFADNVAGKKAKVKVGKAAKKVKRFFVHKKHHNKKDTSTSSTSLSMIAPTATTFTHSATFISTDVYLTYTDKNFNYFLGYPTAGGNGANFYGNQRFMVAQPTQKCGCCDNKLIIVTRGFDDNQNI